MCKICLKNDKLTINEKSEILVVLRLVAVCGSGPCA
jgi:hypothetical protein